MLRIVRTNPLDDQIFRGDVGFGNEIDVAFVGDLRDAETLHQQMAGLAGHVYSKVKHVFHRITTKTLRHKFFISVFVSWWLRSTKEY